jgi:hypothetical protein
LFFIEFLENVQLRRWYLDLKERIKEDEGKNTMAPLWILSFLSSRKIIRTNAPMKME